MKHELNYLRKRLQSIVDKWSDVDDGGKTYATYQQGFSDGCGEVVDEIKELIETLDSSAGAVPDDLQ